MPEISPTNERYEAERQEAAFARREWRNTIEAEYAPRYERPQEFPIGAGVLTDDEPPVAGTIMWYGIDDHAMEWMYHILCLDGVLYSYPPGSLRLA